MPELKRPTIAYDVSRSKMGTGIMRARVVNNLDPTYSGALEVFILRDEANDKGEDTQTFVVTYASPFSAILLMNIQA